MTVRMNRNGDENEKSRLWCMDSADACCDAAGMARKQDSLYEGSMRICGGIPVFPGVGNDEYGSAGICAGRRLYSKCGCILQ